MDSNRIIELILNPEQTLVSDRVTIDQELLRYPYVSAFHMLKLRWNHLYSQQEETQVVEKASIYTNTGEVIKKILTLDKKNGSLPVIMDIMVEADKSEHSCHSNDEKVEVKEEQNFQSENQINVMQLGNENPQEKLTVEDKQGEKNSFINKLGISHLFTNSNSEKFNEADQGNSKHEIDEIDEMLKAEVSEESNHSTEEKENNFVEEVVQSVEKIEEVQEIVNSVPEPTGNESAKVENIQEPENSSKDKLSTVEKLSFNEWLSLSSKKVVIDDEDSKEKTSEEQEKQKDVIDKFIETNPKITTPKKEISTKQDISFKKEEIKDIANLMTITLAQLYVEQGKYDTAITAFKILSLKYPEKSSYFATEIKKIRKLKNSK